MLHNKYQTRTKISPSLLYIENIIYRKTSHINDVFSEDENKTKSRNALSVYLPKDRLITMKLDAAKVFMRFAFLYRLIIHVNRAPSVALLLLCG